MDKKYDYMFSVILPHYNQFKQLKVTLRYFEKQLFPQEHFEVIVINDGVSSKAEEILITQEYEINLKVVTIPHSGSGVARNEGAKIAQGQFLVFCDADRIPDVAFLNKYKEAIQKYKGEKYVFQGRVQECYAVDIFGSDEKTISRFSRDNQYYKKIMNIYAHEKTISPICWASFLVGNSCVPQKLFEHLGGFDPQYNVWGFEHFDLAIRMMEMDVCFINVCEAKNYHIPHSKSKEEYVRLFENSAMIMNTKYPKYNRGFDYLVKYLCGEISLQQFEVLFGGRSSFESIEINDIYYKL